MSSEDLRLWIVAAGFLLLGGLLAMIIRDFTAGPPPGLGAVLAVTSSMRVGDERGLSVGKLYLTADALLFRPFGFPFPLGDEARIELVAIRECFVQGKREGVQRPIVVRTHEGSMFRFYLSESMIGPATKQLKWVARVQDGMRQSEHMA